MTDPAPGDHRELEAIQRQLADTRQHIAELEALIGEMPAIYERKFEQQLQPLLEQERLLLQQNLLLRDQLLRALPGHTARLLLPPSQVQAPLSPGPTPVPGQGRETKSEPGPDPSPEPGPGPGAGPEPGPGPDSDPMASAQPDTLITQGQQPPPAQPQPTQPPSALAAAPGSAPVAPPRAPEPPEPEPTGPHLGPHCFSPGQTPGRPHPRYRLALAATLAALGTFGLALHQLNPIPCPHCLNPQVKSSSPSAGPGANPRLDPTAKPGPQPRPTELGPMKRDPHWNKRQGHQGQVVDAPLLKFDQGSHKLGCQGAATPKARKKPQKSRPHYPYQFAAKKPIPKSATKHTLQPLPQQVTPTPQSLDSVHEPEVD